MLVVDTDGLAHRVGVTEKGFGGGRSEDDGEGVVQCGGGVSLEQGEWKNAEEIFAGRAAVGVDFMVANEKVMVLKPIRFGHGGDLGEVLAEGCREGKADGLLGIHYATVAGVIHFHLVDLFVSGKETVIGIFVENPEADQEGDGHTGAEADDIEGAVDFIVDEVTPGGGEEALEHG